MRSFLTITKNVISNVTSPDDKPSGIAGPSISEIIDIPSFFIGVLIGIIFILLVTGIIKYTKFIIQENKKFNEKIKEYENQNNNFTKSE